MVSETKPPASSDAPAGAGEPVRGASGSTAAPEIANTDDGATTLPLRRRKPEPAAPPPATGYAHLDIDHGFAWEGEDGPAKAETGEDFKPPPWVDRVRRQRLRDVIRTEIAWVVSLAVAGVVIAVAATALVGPPATWGPALDRALWGPANAPLEPPAQTPPPPAR